MFLGAANEEKRHDHLPSAKPFKEMHLLYYYFLSNMSHAYEE